jgi:hypothetical protein
MTDDKPVVWLTRNESRANRRHIGDPMSDTKYDALSKAATAAQERGDPATVRVHFPSEESGMIEDWSMCTPEMAALIEYGRRCRKQLRKKDEAAVWRAARRYRAKPSPKRAKALAARARQREETENVENRRRAQQSGARACSKLLCPTAFTTAVRS